MKLEKVQVTNQNGLFNMQPNETLTNEEKQLISDIISKHLDNQIMLSGDMLAIAKELREAQNLVVNYIAEEEN